MQLLGCRQHQLDSLHHDEVPFNHIYITQSSSSNTITVWRDLVTRRGRRLLFPTPLCCLAALAVQQNSLQRRCQVIHHSDIIFIFFHRRWRLWIKPQRRSGMRDSWCRSRGVRYIDKPYRLSIYRHVLKISISISISIRSLLKISISISISIKTFIEISISISISIRTFLKISISIRSF